MIVITMTKVPASLRGDLTKWCQEIQTGIFVGNVNKRIRLKLWKRICTNIGSGQATMVFSTNNELGYQFLTTSVSRQVIDYDGIPLLMHLIETKAPIHPGFSNAAKYHRIHEQQRMKTPKTSGKIPAFVVLDIETTGTNIDQDSIIAIGAVKHDQTGKIEHIQQFIKLGHPLPKEITKLTGITDSKLATEGVELDNAMENFRDFIGTLKIVGYNISFDLNFIRQALRQLGENNLVNQSVDLLSLIKQIQKFLPNYRLATVLKKYSINNEQAHDALSDAQATMLLAEKLIENGQLEI